MIHHVVRQAWSSLVFSHTGLSGLLPVFLLVHILVAVPTVLRPPVQTEHVGPPGAAVHTVRPVTDRAQGCLVAAVEPEICAVSALRLSWGTLRALEETGPCGTALPELAAV